jgi:hypothetical protein
MSTDVSEVHTASIIRAMVALRIEAVRISETWVCVYETAWHSTISEKALLIFILAAVRT